MGVGGGEGRRDHSCHFSGLQLVGGRAPLLPQAWALLDPMQTILTPPAEAIEASRKAQGAPCLGLWANTEEEGLGDLPQSGLAEPFKSQGQDREQPLPGEGTVATRRHCAFPYSPARASAPPAVALEGGGRKRKGLAKSTWGETKEGTPPSSRRGVGAGGVSLEEAPPPGPASQIIEFWQQGTRSCWMSQCKARPYPVKQERLQLDWGEKHWEGSRHSF